MPQISVIIITLNEERNIERCLLSIKDVADEIIVVDSFSTDRTEEICKQYGAKFIQHKFEGYTLQKNWAVNQATFDCVLSLDADEALSDELKQSILSVKNNWKSDGYYFNRLNNYCGQWMEHTWYPSRKLRLWDRRKGMWEGEHNIHEKVEMHKGSNVKFLKGNLLHYSYYTIEEHILQINKFSKIAALAYHQKGKKSRVIEMIFNPIWRFLRDYILKLGFIDGFYGFVVSINSAHETFLKYTKLRKLYLDEKNLKPFRVCFFNSTTTWGGGEKWHFDTATRIAAKGYDTIVVTNQKSELLQQVIRTGLRYHRVSVNNLSFLNIFKIIHLILYFRRQKVSTIIVNLSADLKLAGISAKLAGVKKIIYSRGIAVPIRDTFINRFLLRNIVTDIIANSEETKRTVLERNSHLVDASKIKIIYNGIDFNEYNNHKYKEIYTRQGNEVIIGNAGRFSEEKGHEHLIQLAKKLNDQNVNFKLLLAGKGKLESKLKKSVETLGLTNKVIFLGFVKDMISFHENIDIFVLSSHYEGFGYVLVESMAKEKPVVAFNIGSSEEIIDDGVNGFLIEKFDTDQLTEKVKQLIEDENLRKTMGKKGFIKAKERFSIERTINEVESLF